MKKKVISRTSSSRTNRKTRINTKYSTNKVKIFYTKFYLLGFAVLAVGAGLFGYKTGDQPVVLGTSILAENRPAEANIAPENQNGNPIHPQVVKSLDRASEDDKSALVDCSGPDGKHFQTELQDCAALNKKWNRPNFSYIELKPQTTPGAKPPMRKMQWMKAPNASDSGKGDLQHRLKNNEIPVSAKSAVERVLQTGAINSVEKEASSEAEVPGSTPTMMLTQVNNQAVYKINGFSNKKVLGIFPAAFAKTVYVSADDGTVVKTDQTFFSKMLEGMSF